MNTESQTNATFSVLSHTGMQEDKNIQPTHAKCTISSDNVHEPCFYLSTLVPKYY